MKCLKNSQTGTIVRVEDKVAHQMQGNTWKYVSKNEWKNVVRPKVDENVEETKKLSKPKKKNIKEKN